MHNYRNMRIYERAINLVTDVYRLTRRLPLNEMFGLTSQMRRAAVSVVLNIAEGSGASTNREFARFLDIARRSVYEISACLEVCVRMGLIVVSECGDVVAAADSLAAMISRFKSQLLRA
jgi:four helix bundle protein